jgi:hypothetical protein
MTKRRKISPSYIIGTGAGLVNQNSKAFKLCKKVIRVYFEELEKAE